MNFDDYGDIHVPAVILKTFLRELPQPLLTFRAYEQILGITSTCLLQGCPPRVSLGGRGCLSSDTVGHRVHGQAGPPQPG